MTKNEEYYNGEYRVNAAIEHNYSKMKAMFRGWDNGIAIIQVGVGKEASYRKVNWYFFRSSWKPYVFKGNS